MQRASPVFLLRREPVFFFVESDEPTPERHCRCRATAIPALRRCVLRGAPVVNSVDERRSLKP
jgi:hypothetical protein